MKKKSILLFIFVLLFSSCSVTKQTGKFNGRTPGMGSFVPPADMVLTLKSDGTFGLYWLQVNYTGKWEVSRKNYLLLKFYEITDPFILLRSGIISDREREIKFINKNKIDIGYCILKREK